MPRVLRSQALKAWSCQPPPIPKDPCLGQGVHWSSGGLLPASQLLGWGPWPQKLWAGRQAGPGQSTGASRPCLRSAFPGKALGPLGLPCVLVGAGAAGPCTQGEGRRHCSHWWRPTPGTAASAWGRSTGCRAGDCIEWCAWARQGAGQRGKGAARGFGRPRFGFVILRDRRRS